MKRRNRAPHRIKSTPVWREIQVIRDREKLTQNALAELLGTTERSVQRWETGERPRLRTRLRIHKLFKSVTGRK